MCPRSVSINPSLQRKTVSGLKLMFTTVSLGGKFTVQLARGFIFNMHDVLLYNDIIMFQDLRNELGDKCS